MATADSTVEYLDIPRFPGYRVGNDGSVWSCWRTRPGGRFESQWRPMKLSPGTRGYLRVNLTSSTGEVQMFRVHRLVLEVFTGDCPDGMECRHLNGIKTDNRLDNLVWGTPEENRNDNHTLGTYQTGEAHSQAKLTAERVRAMRARRETGASLQDISDEFGVGVPNVSMIVNRKTWKHV